MPKTESSSRPVYAEINLNLFKENLSYLKRKTGTHFFCPMLKANAYGHGDVDLSLECMNQSVNVIGLATIEEAIHIRKSGYLGEILVFSPVFTDCLEVLNEYSLTPVVSSIEQLKNLENISIHLKINTGMNRMGVDLFQIEDSLSICKKKGLEISGVLTHLLNGADIKEKESYTKQQLIKFKECLKFFNRKTKLHIYNSDAILNLESADYGVRPGISLYGYGHPDLKPIMQLKAKLVSLRKIKAGEVVSYGPLWKADRNTLIGVLPIGYADGLRRSLSGKYKFSYKGEEVGQVGAVCMDYCMVDLTNIKQSIFLGEEITLFGDIQSRLEDQAKLADTITYDLLTSISDRVTRVYIR